MFYIITKNTIPGFHSWPDAPPEFEYLRNIHRHEFVITCKFQAGHANRDMEIINQQTNIAEWLLRNYPSDDSQHINIGGMSCEMLAEEIAEYFGAVEVTVQEDGQGGAAYVRQ